MLNKVKAGVNAVVHIAKDMWRYERRVVYSAIIGFAVGFFVAW